GDQRLGRRILLRKPSAVVEISPSSSIVPSTAAQPSAPRAYCRRAQNPSPPNATSAKTVFGDVRVPFVPNSSVPGGLIPPRSNVQNARFEWSIARRPETEEILKSLW